MAWRLGGKGASSLQRGGSWRTRGGADHMLGFANQRPEPLAVGLGTNTDAGGQVGVEVLGRKVGGRHGLSFKANGAASDGPCSAELGRVDGCPGT